MTSADDHIDSARTLEAEQIVLLKMQVRYMKIICILLACLLIAVVLVSFIVLPDVLDTLEQTRALLEKINEGNGENIDKLNDAIDKLSTVLKFLPFGG